MLKVYCCYAHQDEDFLKRLEKHLAPLRKGTGVLDLWSAQDIEAGKDWKREIEEHLRYAHIILLLVSPDFIASDLCYSLGMQRAIEKHQKGEAVVIPIVLRSVLWQVTPIGILQALPKNNKPIAAWRDRDAAFLSVVSEIWRIMKNLIERDYQKLGASSRDLYEARSGVVGNGFNFEGLFLPESHRNISKEKGYKVLFKFIRSLELTRKSLLSKSKCIFLRREIYNSIKYLFRSSADEKSEAILENEEFLRMCNEILGTSV